MSALDGVDDFRFRVFKVTSGTPGYYPVGVHVIEIEVITDGEIYHCRELMHPDMSPATSAIDWLMRRATAQLKNAIDPQDFSGLTPGPLPGRS